MARMRRASSTSSSLLGRTAASIASRAVSLTDWPLALALAFSRRATLFVQIAHQNVGHGRPACSPNSDITLISQARADFSTLRLDYIPKVYYPMTIPPSLPRGV